MLAFSIDASLNFHIPHRLLECSLSRKSSFHIYAPTHVVIVLNRLVFTSPLLFHRFEVTRGDSNRSLKNYGFLYDAIFSSHVRMCTNHLATKCNYYTRLLN